MSAARRPGLVAVGCLLCLAACAPLTSPEPPTATAPAPTEAPVPACLILSEVPMRFLALGDSYTIGEGVDAAERWPVQLTARLRAEGVSLEDPVIIARTGWTTDELSAALDAADPGVLGSPFDLVSLLIGVNNQYRGRSVAEYRAEFAALLERAIGFAYGDPRNVLVLSIPDWSVTPFIRSTGRDPAVVAEAIDRFNAANRAETERAGARYVDVTPASRRAAQDEALVAPDGLHPSGALYAEWARLAFAEACAALRGDP